MLRAHATAFFLAVAAAGRTAHSLVPHPRSARATTPRERRPLALASNDERAGGAATETETEAAVFGRG